MLCTPNTVAKGIATSNKGIATRKKGTTKLEATSLFPKRFMHWTDRTDRRRIAVSPFSSRITCVKGAVPGKDPGPGAAWSLVGRESFGWLEALERHFGSQMT